MDTTGSKSVVDRNEAAEASEINKSKILLANNVGSYYFVIDTVKNDARLKRLAYKMIIVNADHW